jgi:hypothetical protein
MKNPPPFPTPRAVGMIKGRYVLSHPILLNTTYRDTRVVVAGSMIVRNKTLNQNDLNLKSTLAKAYPTNRLMTRLHTTQLMTTKNVFMKNLPKVYGLTNFHPAAKLSNRNWLGSRSGLDSTSDEGLRAANIIHIRGYSIIRPRRLIRIYTMNFVNVLRFNRFPSSPNHHNSGTSFPADAG